MNNTLLPCPFCGGEAKIKSRYIGYGSVGLGAHDWYSVECKECRAKGYEYGTELEAIAAWNRRSDAVPVVRGEWEKGKCGPYFICSGCLQVADFAFDFCPACGADMRKEPDKCERI